MFIACVVVSIILAVVLVGSARAKLTGNERVVTSITSLGVPRNWFPFLAACEIAGAIGLIVGLWLAPLGIAAAIGVILYFLGAIIGHLRGRDTKGLPAPVVILIVTVIALWLRIATA